MASSAFIRVDVRAAEVLNVLRNGEKRMTWAIANAINATLKDAQAGIRATAEKRMHIRSAFVRRQLAVLKFATGRVPNPSGRVYVGQKDRLLLGEFERGGTRRPFVGSNVAIPLVGGPARPTKSSPVRKSMGFPALAFHRKGKSIQGQKRTYIVPDVGVFQRTGPGKRDSRMVYLFRPTVRLDARLQFEATARRVVGHVFPHNLRFEVEKTFAHHGFSTAGAFSVPLPAAGLS